MELKIKQELENHIWPLKQEEFEQLEKNIIESGIRDSIIVWDGYIIDGHNRYKIAKKHNLEFKTENISLKDLDEAKDWIDKNQIGRRNLTLDQLQISIGRRYLAEKKLQSGIGKNQYNKCKVPNFGTQQNENNNLEDKVPNFGTLIEKTDVIKTSGKTSEKLAKEYGVTHNTIINYAKKAQDFDKLKAEEPEIYAEVQKGNKTITEAKKDIKEKKYLNDNKSNIKEVELRLCPYDNNMFYNSSSYSEDRFGDSLMSMTDLKFQTVTTLSRFFDKQTKTEISLRDYAEIQTFPKDFVFVGTYSTIKYQIGNAVAPVMGSYIGRFLKGKSCGDLFAGCGGFSQGLSNIGIKSKWAIEWNLDASTSYKANHKDAKVFNTNIKALNPSDFESVDVIIGGPPCQGFSSANTSIKGVRSFKSDIRNELYKEFVRFLEVLKPKEFIMENVKEIQNVKEEIIKEFEDIGYSVKTELVKGNDIGMKQNRIRFFFIGVLND